MLGSTKVALKYAIFALISTAANISAQDVVTGLYTGAFHILASIVVGTGVGLIVKYVLDKRFIFRFRARSIAHDTQVFALYTFMGIVTTVIFWAVEFGFDHIYQTKEMRYLGGAIGLAIGYLTKYHLDRRYVFGETTT